MKNTVILNKDASTWPRIKKYWEDMGVDTSVLRGDFIGAYYGVIDDNFWHYSLDIAKRSNAEIIELPEEKKDHYIKMLEEKYVKKYPRVMWVWDDDEEKEIKVVFAEKCGQFIAWNCNSLEDVDRTLSTSYWDNAKDFDFIEVTLEEIAAWKGVSKERVKVKM